MKRSTSLDCLVTCSVLLSFSGVSGQNESKGRVLNNIDGPAGTPSATLSNINRIAAWYYSDGNQEINLQTGNAGLTFPRGTATAIFAGGLIWGGIFNDGRTPALRVNGQSYSSGTKPGAILGIRTGIAEDPNSPDVRIWRIRRDFATSDLTQDAAEINSVPIATVTEGQIQAIRDQYLTDWLEWPAHKGAPFYDADSDGVYTPMITGGVPVLFPNADEPGLANADQVLWSVCNDIGIQTVDERGEWN